MLCYVMLCYVMLCYVILCYIMLYYIILYYIILYYIILYYIILYYIILWPVTKYCCMCTCYIGHILHFYHLLATPIYERTTANDATDSLRLYHNTSKRNLSASLRYLLKTGGHIELFCSAVCVRQQNVHPTEYHALSERSSVTARICVYMELCGRLSGSPFKPISKLPRHLQYITAHDRRHRTQAALYAPVQSYSSVYLHVLVLQNHK